MKITKAILLTATIALLTTQAFAQADHDVPEDKRAKPVKPVCEPKFLAYQPWAQDLDEAAGTFGAVAEHAMTACKVKEKIQLINDGTTSQSMSISGYREIDTEEFDTQEITYTVMTFVKGTHSHDAKCIVRIVKKPIFPKVSDGPVVAMARFEVTVSEPKCVTYEGK